MKIRTTAARRNAAEQTLSDARGAAAQIDRRLKEKAIEVSDARINFGNDILTLGRNPDDLRADIARLAGERDQIQREKEENEQLCESLIGALANERYEVEMAKVEKRLEEYHDLRRQSVKSLAAFDAELDKLQRLEKRIVEPWNAAHPLPVGQEDARYTWGHRVSAVHNSNIRFATARTVLERIMLAP